MAEARLFESGNRLVGGECPDHRSTSRIGNNAQRVVERCIYRQADFECGDSGLRDDTVRARERANRLSRPADNQPGPNFFHS